jgi:hypothetical protein
MNLCALPEAVIHENPLSHTKRLSLSGFEPALPDQHSELLLSHIHYNIKLRYNLVKIFEIHP